jgi:hypothetical protein
MKEALIAIAMLCYFVLAAFVWIVINDAITQSRNNS